MSPKSDYVPRQYYDRQITALTARSIQAEEALVSLLQFIDPDILTRHHGDYLSAVKELVS